MQVKNNIRFIIVCVVPFLFFFKSQIFAENKEEEIREIIIGLEWQLNVHHAVLLIADSAGFFKENRLRVKFITTGGNQDSCKLTTLGKVDFSVTSQPQLYIQNYKGFNLKHVATLIRKPIEVILSRWPVNELVGKKIGYGASEDGFSKICLKTVMNKNGVDINNIHLVFSKQSLLAVFLARKLDAITNIYKTSIDPKIYKGREVRIISYQNNGMPDFSPMILVTLNNQKFELTQKVRNSLQKSLDLINSNSNLAWKKLKEHPRLINSKRTKGIWKRLIKYLPKKISDLAPPLRLKQIINNK